MSPSEGRDRLMGERRILARLLRSGAAKIRACEGAARAARYGSDKLDPNTAMVKPPTMPRPNHFENAEVNEFICESFVTDEMPKRGGP